ncbi:MAG: PDZ domain-containing protein [Gammaproteobacteria bacterium]|nr:PDZ domain-containing protein [Gammaproteobacteria bacterium]MCP4982249.1 PDZ domain-containing protein [Gammaproteobacteria bacterium]
MNRKSTILWRFAVLGLFASLLPLGIYILEKHDQVDTDRMLDVSVSIRTTSHVTVDKFGDSVWEISNGSGFLVSSSSCEVWTNHHVIENAALVEVYPRGWQGTAGIPAKVINSTPRFDVAILKLDDCTDLPAATLGNSDLLHPGDETFAVGNPLGRNPDSISRGIISHTQRYREGTTPYLQTDAAINPGNSGGALFDHEGKVIGINSAIDTTRNGTNLGIGFAVPINLVMQVVGDLRQGPPSWGDAGLTGIVSTLTPDEAEVFRVPGGSAALVVTRTPAEGPSAGRVFAHDVIYQIDDTNVIDAEQVIRMVGQHSVGETLELALIRSGEERSVDIILGEGWQSDTVPQPDKYDGYLGMTLEMWDVEEGDRALFKRPVITKVHSMGPAHKAHISSSQKSVMINGPFVVPYILDVKTVIGVVYQGELHAITLADEVEHFAAQAYQTGNPLLLEIEYWARTDPMDNKTSLKLADTAFFKLLPRRATAEISNPALRKALGLGNSVPITELTLVGDRPKNI